MKSVLVKVYDKCKYSANSTEIKAVVITNVCGVAVKSMSDDDILTLGFDETDEYGEYVIITFADGTTSIYRNSVVDIFAV